MSIFLLLLVLLMGTGGHTDASKFSIPKLPRSDPSSSLPKPHSLLEEPLGWVCQNNNPSHPSCPGNKFSWPELLGNKGNEAKAVVQRENPYIDSVVYAPQDAIVAENYCCNRVRLIMNCDDGCDYENATVFQVPIVG
nr:unnamed protein product [Digitaria exilis]